MHIEVKQNGYILRGERRGHPDGPTVIFSHSLGTDRSLWDPQVTALEKMCDIVLYDHPGHGESSMRPDAGDISDYGRDVIAIADALGVERFFFCGLSLGGMVGLWLGAHGGERLNGLFLSNTSACNINKDLLRNRIAKIRAEGLEGILDGMMEKWFTPPFRAAHPALMEQFRAMVRRCGPESYAQCSEMICAMDQRASLASIRVPCTVGIGALDDATPPAWGRVIADAVPGAKIAEFQSAHLANVEAETAFNEALKKDLLDGIDLVDRIDC